jgi:ketosteroid isomerase-like protein
MTADSVTHAPGCIHAAPEGDSPNVVAEMMDWWNRAYSEHALDEAGFGRFFTEDAVFLVDDAVRARGLAGLAEYFGAIRANSDNVVLHPPEDSFATGDRIFVHYRVTGEANGVHEAHEVMATARVSYGKIAFFKAIRRIIRTETQVPQ